MRVIALCAAEFYNSTKQATGIEPYTFPSLDNRTFDASLLESADLIYVDLHGAPGRDYWSGNEVVALTAQQVRELDLKGKTVFALSCFLGDTDSPMLDALLDAGVKYVIGGAGTNYAGANKPAWGGMLGRIFVSLVRLGLDPLRALALGKHLLNLNLTKDKFLRRRESERANLDTLNFKAYYRKN